MEAGAKHLTQSMQTSVDRTVSDITLKQRHALEELVGGDLSPDQRIFVLAYRPGVEPTEADKSVARIRIKELLAKAHENVNQQGLAAAEIEAAIAEAIESTGK
jgi:LDH2 family malate/lactate/ureidoglycolate dehydrogenase